MNFVLLYLSLLFIIFLHETGHAIAAYFAGSGINKVNIGLGPTIFNRDKLHLRLLPLYGSIDLMTPKNSIFQPFSILLGGSIANVILAVILLFMANLIGIKTLTPQVIDKHPSVDKVVDIIRINNNPVSSWDEINKQLLTDYFLGRQSSITTPHHTYHAKLDKNTFHQADFIPINALGFEKFIPPTPCLVESIAYDSPAYHSGIVVNKEITHVDGIRTHNTQEFFRAIQKKIGQTVTMTQGGHIIIYTKDHCPYCDYAKALLKSNKLAYTEHNLEGNYDEVTSLVAKTNMKTLPQIFVQGQFVGGFTDLQGFDASGKLGHLIGQNKYTMTLGYTLNQSFRITGYAGIKFVLPPEDPSLYQHIKYTPMKAMFSAFSYVLNQLKFYSLTLFSFILGTIPFKVFLSPQSIITTPLLFLKKLEYGNYLYFLGQLNCAFAFINILPIPGLDGGLIIFKAYEKIFHTRLKSQPIILIHRLSFLIFTVALIHLLVGDILRNIQ